MERNERNTVGLRNFFDSLASVLVGIRNLQTSQIGIPEAEEILTQLEEASVTLRLLESENAHGVYMHHLEIFKRLLHKCECTCNHFAKTFLPCEKIHRLRARQKFQEEQEDHELLSKMNRFIF